MSRGPLTFRQRDVDRAVRVAQAAGLEVVGIEVNRRAGTFRVLTARPSETQSMDEVGRWIAEHAHDG